MKLTKLIIPSDDSRYAIYHRGYLAHCENIANIIAAAAAGQKTAVRQELIDLYLISVNTDNET